MEYLALSRVATGDVLATVLEEMPPFPEKESSLLTKLKKKKPQVEETVTAQEKKSRPQAIMHDSNSLPVRIYLTSLHALCSVSAVYA